jgi:hypothetical protein
LGIWHLEIWCSAPDPLIWKARKTRRTGHLMGEERVITLSDLIGFSDLTEAEVQAIARHEHVTPLGAVVLGCQLMGSPTGQNRILECLHADLEAARQRRNAQKVAEIETALARFRRRHTAPTRRQSGHG